MIPLVPREGVLSLFPLGDDVGSTVTGIDTGGEYANLFRHKTELSRWVATSNI